MSKNYITIQSKIENLKQLINGEFPDELQESFLGEDGLFQLYKKSHINPVGVCFDEKLFLFFKLRGIDVNRLSDTKE